MVVCRSACVHLASVLGVLIWWTAALIGHENIAVGLGIMAMGGLGLPWSIPMFLDPYYYGLWPVGVVVVLTLGALINVTIHALFQLRRWRRDTSEKATTQRA